MWSSRLFWRVFLVYAGLNLGLAILFLLVVASWHRGWVTEQVRSRLTDDCYVLRSRLPSPLPNRFDAELQQWSEALGAETDARLTLISAAGVVVADSNHADPRSMDNHGGRPEVKAARASGLGVNQRHSASMGFDMLYVAVPLAPDDPDAGFVRFAMSLEAIQQQASTLRLFVWMIAGATGVIAVALTYVAVRGVVRPLEELTRNAKAVAAGKGRSLVIRDKNEVGLLAESLNELQDRLAEQMVDLRAQSDRLEAVLGGMVEGVIAVDEQERVLLANKASRQLLAFSTDEIIGRPLFEATRSLPVRDAVTRVLASDEAVHVEFESPGPMRKAISLRASRFPQAGATGVVVVLHDVSELRRLESIRREFISSVSHELKTPLSSIKAYAETLRLGALADTENNMTFLSNIEEQADRLHQLILDMLDLARMESDTAGFQISEMSVTDAVRKSVERHLTNAEAKSIQFEIAFDQDPLIIRADEEGVGAILDNLLSNAIKYTPAGGRITVGCRVEGADGVLEVRDTGIGIAPQHQARVFERFYRVDPARSRELGGTGLGLAIVKHLAQAFGGTVGVESAPGEGSRFYVTFPLAV